MATMLPPQPVPGTSRGEIRTFMALSALPTDWLCFHSVRWFGAARQGEGDFIVVAPAGGLVFVEVKSRCTVDATGQWTRHKSNVVVKDPWEQAGTTGREVSARLRRAGVARRPYAAVACFPMGDPMFEGGLAAQQQRSLSATVLDDSALLEATLIDCLWEAGRRDTAALAAFKADELAIIRQTLLVTGQVAIPTPLVMAHAEEDRVSLTQEQVETYVELMSITRLLTIGGAGSGKTLLAAARAAQLARQGVPLLFVAANALAPAFQ